MKLRVKILMLALIPLVLLGSVVCVITVNQFRSSMEKEIEDELLSAVYLQRDSIAQEDGTYDLYLADDGVTLMNGPYFNITEETEAPDMVKAKTGTVLTIFFDKTRRMTTVTNANGRVLGTDAGQAVIDKVLKGGNEYFADNVDVVGEKYYAYYIPLYNTADPKTPVGMVFAGKSQATVDKKISSTVTLIVGVIVGIIILCAAICLFIVNKISGSIKSGVDAIGKLADGDLTVKLDAKQMESKDETGDMVRSVDNLSRQLKDVIGGIIEKSNDVREFSETLGQEAAETTDAVSQVEKAVLEIADGATSQANDTQKATESVITMGNLVEETNNNVENLYQVSNEMEQSGKNAANTLRDLEQVNVQAKQSIEIIYNQTNTTNESAKKISEAINLITSIAEETNLLSLNASIEAARAGEQGRGFAVVASQIQKLAEQSNDSAKQIESIINSLMADSQKAVQTMDEVNEIMAKQSEMVEKTSEIFADVIEGIKQSRAHIEEISDNTKSLNVSREGVVDIVQNLSAIAEENAASTEETSASTTEVSATIQEMTANAMHLKTIAQELEDSVSIFKTE